MSIARTLLDSVMDRVPAEAQEFYGTLRAEYDDNDLVLLMASPFEVSFCPSNNRANAPTHVPSYASLLRRHVVTVHLRCTFTLSPILLDRQENLDKNDPPC